MQILEEPKHPSFQGVQAVQLGGDRIWGKDLARLKSLVSAVEAVAPHARFVALLDRGGHDDAECEKVARLLSDYGVKTSWLPDGELEEFWLKDIKFCAEVCRFVALSAGVEIASDVIKDAIDKRLVERTGKSSGVLRSVFGDLNLQFSKVAIANAATTLMAKGQESNPKDLIVEALERALEETPVS